MTRGRPSRAAALPRGLPAAGLVRGIRAVAGLLGPRPAPRPRPLAVDPVQPWSFGATRISGLGTHGRPVDIEVSADGAGVLMTG